VSEIIRTYDYSGKCWSRGRGADIGAVFRHSGTTRTGPNDMIAAFMLFQVHGWDIHAVKTWPGGALMHAFAAMGRSAGRLRRCYTIVACGPLMSRACPSRRARYGMPSARYRATTRSIAAVSGCPGDR
jgi:hypothetical protein